MFSGYLWLNGCQTLFSANRNSDSWGQHCSTGKEALTDTINRKVCVKTKKATRGIPPSVYLQNFTWHCQAASHWLFLSRILCIFWMVWFGYHGISLPSKLVRGDEAAERNLESHISEGYLSIHD